MHEQVRLQLFARLNGHALGESCRAEPLCRVERGLFGKGRLPAHDHWLHVRRGDVLGEAEAKVS